MKEERYYSLDVLKIIATIGIVFHHFQQVTGVVYEGHINFWGGKFYWGYLVELFFVLSGFFCYKFVQKIESGMSFKAFILRRIKRLLPMVAITAVVYEANLYLYYRLYTQGVEGAWFGTRLTVWGTIIDMCGIQEGWVFSNPSVNNPTWYISVLILCYIVFFFVVWFSGRKSIPSVYLFVLVILLGCGIQTYGLSLPFLNASSSRGYCAFFAGVILAYSMDHYELQPAVIAMVWLSVIGIPWLIICKPDWVAHGLGYLLTFIFYPCMIVLFQTKPIRRIFSSPIWGTWGKISFDVFMWHNLMYLSMYNLMEVFHFSIEFTNIISMYVYAAICECVGVLSYYLLEIPIEKHLRIEYFLKKKG